MSSQDDEKKYFRDREHEPLSFKFRLIHEFFACMINRHLKEEDMTFSQMILIYYLWENRDRKITQKDITDAMHIKHPTTIGLLKRLEEKEMLKVVVDPDNRKYRNIALTEKGITFIENDGDRKRHTEEDMVKGMSSKEIKQLRDLLDKVYDNMQAMQEEKIDI
ncbi:MAG: MarR family transcriptional regulator [Butyrivibrio sp.]|nr:MarR family transcriptional regulator [Butyrivibrio sp.]